MNGLDSLYQQVILDHAKARHGDLVLDGADASHFERNPTCGDEITVSLRLEPGTDRIAAIGWQGDGCSISMASASVLTDMAVGRTVPELLELTSAFRDMMRSRGAGEPDEDVLEDLVAFHGVSKFVMRVKCGMLAWVAAEAAAREASAAH
ncbi:MULTISPECIES: Fe-S cluster assembly sulfur transfer protein SufU [Curtobacterium]|uniref:Nitrogen fixation protein NifU n=1 Tax=Curtobacterium oceanosedimentum TaxID=465820 RepID=A0A147DUZ2_9MICO|nr:MULTISPECIES: SUF system NifU family Fe-S cluster assembly protein [Curtobacterium]KTR39671.1 nitrogen fixation protein NifU [Curtobacterium oceanosedimentum]KTR54396.1 nitrogen fixation protein NifU [Curtobacterium oceanosedimentum]UBQ01731.1 SUF system NifU family Fe-S cluster assembly protein [Curtobacterium sp. TXMA1]